MIDTDAEPLFNVSPYRRIDIKGRPTRITREQALKTIVGGGKAPDPALYDFGIELTTGEEVYILKEGA